MQWLGKEQEGWQEPPGGPREDGPASRLDEAEQRGRGKGMASQRVAGVGGGARTRGVVWARTQ